MEAPSQEPVAVPERVPSALPAQVQQPPAESETTSAKPLTPAAHTRPAPASHRSAAKFKTTDQAVVMPVGSFAAGVEKIGMQFGSLSIGGDDLDAAGCVLNLFTFRHHIDGLDSERTVPLRRYLLAPKSQVLQKSCLLSSLCSLRLLLSSSWRHPLLLPPSLHLPLNLP